MQSRSLARATWPDILAFLGLAALLGLAAGLLLGSMALLLAVPAYAQDRAPEKTSAELVIHPFESRGDEVGRLS